MGQVLIGVYWGQRKESREDAASRIAEFLKQLGSAHPSLATWFRKAASRNAAKEPLEISKDGVVSLLEEHRRDVGPRTPLADVGFSMAAWNGEAMSLSLNIGAFSQFVGNYVVLDGRNDSLSNDHEVLRRVLAAAISSFDPDHGVAVDPSTLAKFPRSKPWEVGGWFTFERGGELVSQPKK